MWDGGHSLGNLICTNTLARSRPTAAAHQSSRAQAFVLRGEMRRSEGGERDEVREGGCCAVSCCLIAFLNVRLKLTFDFRTELCGNA